MAEGDQTGGEAGPPGFDGLFDVAGALAPVRADGRLAGGQGLSEGGGGVLAGLDGGGSALGSLFGGEGLALGPAAFPFRVLLFRSPGHLDVAHRSWAG